MAPARRRAYGSEMIKNFLRTAGHTGLVSGAALLAILTGCSKSQSDTAVAAAQPAAPTPAAVAQAQPTVALQDDYVYYPAYEVYYSSNRHDYRYREGNAWVTRQAPPRVSVDVLLASPSVRVDFHDAPERHHESIVRSYPRNWAPQSQGRGAQDERKDERKDKR